MKTTFYRLAQYKIIEGGAGALWWEAHAGVGAVVGGKCSIRGEILFIGPSESEEAGFLAREFLDQLDRFPKWERTKFYCLNYEICGCKSGRRLTGEEIAIWSKSQTQWTDGNGLSGTPFGTGNQEQRPGSKEDVSYRLRKFQIIQKPDGQVWWKTPSGHTGVRAGKSIIIGDILFLGAREIEEPGNLRSQFIERLDQLPEWTATQYYSLSYALHDCESVKSLSKGEGGSRLTADSLPKGEGLSRKKAKLSGTINPSFSRLQKLLWTIHPNAKTRAAPKEDSVGAEEETHEKGVKNRSGRKSNASKLELSTCKTAIQWLGRRKWIGYVAAFLLTTGFLLLSVLVGHWKKDEGHHKRDDHHSSHRSDH
jgi:hypothetical protein